MDKEIKFQGTIIVLTYRNNEGKKSLKDLSTLIESIEDKVLDKAGLEVFVRTEYGANNRVHHNVLVNRKVELEVEKIWGKGHTSIKHINKYDQFKSYVDYVAC